jgi:hypothetical protein
MNLPLQDDLELTHGIARLRKNITRFIAAKSHQARDPLNGFPRLSLEQGKAE